MQLRSYEVQVNMSFEESTTGTLPLHVDQDTTVRQ